jgi:hypothetical protein
MAIRRKESNRKEFTEKRKEVKMKIKNKEVREFIREEINNMLTEQRIQFTQELLDTVDFKPLESKINSYLGAKVTLDIRFKQLRSGGGGVEFESKEDLTKASGVFASVLKKVSVEDFGSGINEDNQLGVICELRWEFKDGGRNGHTFLNAWYDFDKKKWQFRER